MSSVISLTIQSYFCYRIWTLARNVWLCLLITAVSAPEPFRDCRALDVSLKDISSFSNRVSMGRFRSKYYTDTP
jgi:hypothetical protein